MNNIKLVKVDNSNVDYDLLYSWCQDKNVYEWFEQRVLTKEEIINKYNNKLNNSDQTLLYIDKDNTHIGLVQFYKSDYEYETYNNIYEYDLFIGDVSSLSKGIGTVVVNMINKMLFDDFDADLIVLRPFKRNVRACKCYEKCSFKLIDEYDDVDTLGNKEKYCVYINYR